MPPRQELTVDAERGWTRPAVLVPMFVLTSLVAGLLPAFSLSATLLVLCVGGALFWLGLTHTVARRPAPARLGRSAAWWLIPVGIFAVVELLTFAHGSGPDTPTLSRLADPVLERYLARSALFFGWLAAMWGLVRR